jgi:transcription elongation factor GreB
MDNEDEDGPPRLPGGKFYMTPQGAERLRAEFAAQKAERHRVVEIVAWAAGNGDRSENADYKEGKRRLREIDRRLRFLDKRLAAAVPVDPARQTRRDQVFFGATVTYANARGAENTIKIVGVDEADLERGQVSWVSPIARALLKAREGDTVELRTPAGRETIEVLAIEYRDGDGP